MGSKIFVPLWYHTAKVKYTAASTVPFCFGGHARTSIPAKAFSNVISARNLPVNNQLSVYKMKLIWP